MKEAAGPPIGGVLVIKALESTSFYCCSFIQMKVQAPLKGHEVNLSYHIGQYSSFLFPSQCLYLSFKAANSPHVIPHTVDQLPKYSGDAI